MTLADLKSAIAAFHEKTTSDFSVNGVDLLLLAINNAKRWAQLNYDFELARCSVQVSVNTQTGGALSSAVSAGGSTPVVVKRIESAFLSFNAQGQRPIGFMSKKSMSEDLRRRLGTLPFAPGHNDSLALGALTTGTAGLPVLVQQGDTIFLYPNSTELYPSGSTLIYLDVVKMLPDYVAGDIDFFLTYGAEFLMWRSIVEGNFLWKSFVPREEGNLNPPDALVTNSWNAFKAWDQQIVAMGSTAFDLD